MGNTLNLPCARFVRRVSNGALLSKYSYLAMMARNAEAIETAPWHMATTPPESVSMPVNKVSATDATYDESGVMLTPPSFTAFVSDSFDAFQQGGDARREDGTMCGYAGCVAYRFKMPSSASNVSLTRVDLPVSRDRYNRAGVRIALVLSNDAMPSDDWSVIRGEGSGAIVTASTQSDTQGVASWGFLSQSGVGVLTASRPADGVASFTSSSFPGLAVKGKAYLWAYVTLEDYTSYWTQYSATEPRYYSIEGSAMLVSSRAAFVFASNVTSDAEAYSRMLWCGIAGAHAEGISSHTTQAQKAAYGNLMLPSCASALHITSISDDILTALLNLDKYGAKPLLGTAPDSTIKALAGQWYPMSDVDVVGALQEFGTTDGEYFWPNPYLQGQYIECGVHVKRTIAENVNALREDGTILASVIAYWRYYAMVVPSGKDYYSKLRLTASQGNLIREHTANFDCDLLIWRTDSPSMFGTWPEAAVCAIAGNTAFFTGSRTTVGGQMTGDGTATAGKSVTAEATLLQRVNLDSVTGSQLDIDLAGPLHPGEALIAVPSIKRVPYGVNVAADADIKFSMGDARLMVA